MDSEDYRGSCGQNPHGLPVRVYCGGYAQHHGDHEEAGGGAEHIEADLQHSRRCQEPFHKLSFYKRSRFTCSRGSQASRRLGLRTKAIQKVPVSPASSNSPVARADYSLESKLAESAL